MEKNTKEETMKKTRFDKWHKAALIVLALQVITGIWAIVEITILNMIPTKYYIPIILIIVLCMLVSAAFMLPGRKKNKLRTARRIIGMIVAVAMIIVSTAGAVMVTKVNHTVDKMTDADATSSLVAVYVMASNPAEKLTDAKDYTFGYTKANDYDHTKMAIDGIQEELGTDITLKEYDTLTDMADALYSEKIDAMIINEGYGAVLEGQDRYIDFRDMTRVIYEYEIIEQIEDTEEDTEPELAITERPFAMYVSGSDLFTKKLTKTRSDVNILVFANPTTKQVLLINTPRDYYVVNPASEDGDYDKLTHCGLYGIECSVEALSNLYDVDIDFYSQLNFNGFKDMIDALGGITVVSDKKFTSIDGYHYSKGENYLDGEEALSFVRERQAFGDGDFQRGRDQMLMIQAIIDKASNSETILSNYTDILDSMGETFTTNMSSSDMSALARMQLDDMSSWQVYNYGVIGNGTSKTTYTVPNEKAYVMIQRQDSIDSAKMLINKIMNNQILTDADIDKANEANHDY